jgi:tRNA A-37 threonylcarbamoyl transferase component Bud32
MTVPFANPELAYREHLARALQPGLRLGRLIGRGGFAEVYAAWDEQLKREVAVKVLRYDLAHHETLVARFRREAEAVAQLRHPNVVPIYGIGEGEGLVYFTMPLVRGETLARRLEREPMPPLEEVRRIVLDVADALRAAHTAGIVHRDIKPENIMLEGEEARVLVMDFGIAKAAAAEDGALTAAGMVVGTPQYMSPEQASGEGMVDQRSDIYSLGVVAYQMVTGRVPFSGGSVVGVLIRHATEPPPPIADLRPDCPIAFAAAITRCLEKDPANRWQSAADLRDAVRAAADATGGLPEPLEAAQPGAQSGARVAGRARLVVGLCIVASVVALIADLALDGSLDFAPFVFALAALAAALVLGRAVAAGVPLREIARVGRPATSPRTDIHGAAGTADQSEFGAYAERVRRARAHRTTLVGLLARMPAAERRMLGDVLPFADRVLSETTELARQAQSLERALSGATNVEERRQLAERRAGIARRLDSGVSEIYELRAAVRQAATDGLGAAGARLRSIIRQPEA